MIIQISEPTYAEDFTKIYNSSILLFPERERGMATRDIFEKQIKKDINFAHIKEQGIPDAFASYHRLGERVYEITSLYVSLDAQEKGVGAELLQYMEGMFEENSMVFVKVLKNAPWSIQFYKKQGYVMLEKRAAAVARAFSMEEKPWSMALT